MPDNNNVYMFVKNGVKDETKKEKREEMMFVIVSYRKLSTRKERIIMF